MTSVAGEPWFNKPSLKRIMALLNAGGGEGRVVGGAVRNALMGIDVGDIDIATTLPPDEVIRRATEAGIRSVPTGIAHGTVTLVLDGEGFETTTLRRDVATDGRHAEVVFGTDWQVDAERRDLTINALYADVRGEVIDLIGGLADIESRTVRFIGDAAARISEDYLRVLRFFRFFAFYGSGRPDADGLRASARAKDKLKTLSAERVWSELRKLLSAPDPSRALLWMRQSGVLAEVLPEGEKWGIDAIHGLVADEKVAGHAPDALLRLAAIIPPDAERIGGLATRLRLSKAEAARLHAWASAPDIAPDITDAVFDRLLYRHGTDGIAMKLRLAIAALRGVSADLDAITRTARLNTLFSKARKFVKPQFPLGGADVIKEGIAAGPRVGELLSQLEKEWVDMNFSLDRRTLVTRLRGLVAGA